jgi:Fe2+ or Zn2+ uptake regulation protein
MSDFNTKITEAIRLAILQALAEDQGYSHNQNILQMILGSIGHQVSSDRVRTELRWLEEQGLVTIEDVSGVLVAKITQRGLDAAQGSARIDGVARPRP